jgi:hypothetical protein
MPFDNSPAGDNRMPGILPILPDDGIDYFLCGDGTWQPIESFVEHWEVHTDVDYEE